MDGYLAVCNALLDVLFNVGTYPVGLLKGGVALERDRDLGEDVASRPPHLDGLGLHHTLRPTDYVVHVSHHACGYCVRKLHRVPVNQLEAQKCKKDPQNQGCHKVPLVKSEDDKDDSRKRNRGCTHIHECVVKSIWSEELSALFIALFSMTTLVASV